MTCEHKNSTVKESRPHDYIGRKGRLNYKPFAYPCIIVRRRLCLDCGERFSTVEVLKDYMDGFNLKSVQKTILLDMMAALQQQYRAIDSDAPGDGGEGA